MDMARASPRIDRKKKTALHRCYSEHATRTIVNRPAVGGNRSAAPRIAVDALRHIAGDIAKSFFPS
jgi:hypothetical protein